MVSLNLKGLINKIELNDLSYIQKVIQYFPMISESERHQTVLRITSALTIMGKSVKVHRSNPICNYLKTGTFVNGIQRVSNRQVFEISNHEFDDTIVDSLNSYILSIKSIEDSQDTNFDRVLMNLTSKDILGVYRENVYDRTVNEIKQNSNFAFRWYIINNIITNYCNKKVLSFMRDGGINTLQMEIVNAFLIDANEALLRNEDISPLNVIDSLHTVSTKVEWLPLETLGICNLIDLRVKSPNEKLDYIKSKISTTFLVDNNCMNMLIRSASKIPYGFIPNTLFYHDSFIESLLSSRKAELDTQLYSVLDDVVPTKRYRYHFDEFIQDSRFEWLHNTMQYLSSQDLSKFKRMLELRGLKTKLFDTQLYALKKSGIMQNLVYVPSHDFSVAISKKTAYILTTDNKDKIYMFPIYNGNEMDKVRRIREMSEKLTSRVIEFRDDTATDFISNDFAVIEAANKIEFDKDTNLSFSLKPREKNTYMNRYSDIHSLLVENSRNKNYNAMKTDLCRLYALIYEIERDVTHTTKAVTPSVKADATKARMFAKNDLKRYLAEVTAYDKDFDLAKYFNESDVKAQIEKEYHFKINTMGVKRLLKTLV